MEPKIPCSSSYNLLSISFYVNVIFSTPISADTLLDVFTLMEKETREMSMHMKWHEDNTQKP